MPHDLAASDDLGHLAACAGGAFVCDEAIALTAPLPAVLNRDLRRPSRVYTVGILIVLTAFALVLTR